VPAQRAEELARQDLGPAVHERRLALEYQDSSVCSTHGRVR